VISRLLYCIDCQREIINDDVHCLSWNILDYLSLFCRA
jgi:hypothetical protein